MKKKLGFIGLGIMGAPMVRNLLKKGNEVTVFDLNTIAVEMLAKEGAKIATSGKGVALTSDVVITMLPKGRQVQQAIFGEHGVMEGAREGMVIIDMSSVTPVESKEMYELSAKQGVHFLDAPVSGGEPKAIDGSLTIMVGGKEEVFESVKGILGDMGNNIVLVGESGSGSTAKLANQIIVNLNIAAISEALVFATKAGINVEKMYQAIRGGLAGSTVMDAKTPMILDRNFKAGGRVDINLKDINNVMHTAHELAVPLPLSAQLLEIFYSLKANGMETLDHASIVQHYEKLANVEVSREVR
ncbi:MULTISPECIES: 2-hydroxy-3-oxopropionate reductase [unclassified Lysinibacillus]|uniref:2-hydroxy-3-oxopropionate reductase n=1 Tax=unclassified Lysinibacillus TaxID=2636778 RepID=UPI003814BE1E